ncbi:MAG TPA: glutathione S-transferase family protein [Candidatus Binataceae bacterium]|nr:glutathione S-transferase family protein [Candidatus Binataceae bacterium]
MKLYNMNLSNFATKSRIVVYEKGVNIEMAPIPGAGPSSPEYKKINPLGKIPTLDADGTIIAESEVINEYLEDKYPNPPCCRRRRRAARTSARSPASTISIWNRPCARSFRSSIPRPATTRS